MKVIKRDGRNENVSFDKILHRITALCKDLDIIDPVSISQKVISRIYDGVTTSELDEVAGGICYNMQTENLQYGILASRIIISNMHKNTSPSFSEAMSLLYNNKNEHMDHNPLISEEVYQIIMKYQGKLNSIVKYERDYLFDYFGFKTIEKSYLFKINEKIIERPQYMFLRVSLGIHKEDIKSVIETYEWMSQKAMIHATPTLFHAGTSHPQLLSCFLMGTDDSVGGIFKTMSDCAKISKWAGGIGLHINNIRGKGSKIEGTNGVSNGVIPMLRTYNSISRYINQCFTGDTWVYSKDGPKQMTDITTLDELITVDGSFKKVNEVIVNHVNKEILEITTTNTVRVTKEHEIYVISGKQLEKMEPEFKIACELLVGDYVGYPIPNDKIDFDDKKSWILNSKLEVMRWKYSYLKRGILTSYVEHDIDNYSLKILPDDEYFEWNGILWTKIQSIEKVNFEGNVYDFNMIDNHNYLTDMGLVHNSGKRPGSFAIYMEPHHPEILEFLDLKKNHGAEEERTRDLFLALWISDLFMERVEKNETWSLMDPKSCPGLDDLYGKSYRDKYEEYERNGKYMKQVPARTIFTKILSSQIETGVPYILFKDSANEKSNQKNLGTIKSSNLCVAPETNILTREFGYKQISSLENQWVHIWNGFEWSGVLVRKTSDNAELMKIEFSNGAFLETTLQHKFYIINNLNQIVEIEAKDLQPGMKLESYEYPNMEKNKFDNEFLDFVQNISPKDKWYDNNIREYVMIHTDYQILEKIRLTLLNYGIHQTKIYVKNGLTHLEFSYNSLVKCLEFGWNILNNNQLSQSNNYKNNNLCEMEVHYVTRTGRMSSTYCFTEPLRNKGVFNGILTGQCAEILEYSDHKEYACCTLASIGLPFFVKEDKKVDWASLAQVVEVMVKNLNKVIDLNKYPVPETELSNKKNRPIGIGVQGLADYFLKQRIAFDSQEARKANIELFEFIYYHALKTSCQLAKEFGAYSSFKGSPASEGLLQFDLWSKEPSVEKLDWTQLKKDIITYGLRNSLLLALMPTATTSQILGYNEAFEPYTSNIYTRRTIAGDFVIINNYLIQDLTKLGLWSKEMKDKIIFYNGSIQQIDEISQEIKNLYKTAWEMKQKVIMDLAIDRGRYICQTQSMNLFFEDPSMQTLTNAFMYGWKQGIKTGCYYVRTRPKAQAQQFTIDPSTFQKNTINNHSSSSISLTVDKEAEIPVGFVCSRDNTDCLMCSS